MADGLTSTGLQPLWPFQSLDQVDRWQAMQRASGGDPAHRLDAGATAVEFTRGVLGFTGIDRVTSVSGDGPTRRVGVGWATESGAVRTAATLELDRFVDDATSPWIVVGTSDRNVIARPGYGERVTGAFEIGGRFTGSDDALKVIVVAPGGRVLCVAGPAVVGGTQQAWSLPARADGARPDTLVTLAVSSGGHIAEIEWFAVSGVRIG